MSNQLILWCTVILPWLSIVFLKKQDIKRYMPSAIFGSLLVITVSELGSSLNWWTIKQTVFPLHTFLPFVYGVFPVAIIWINMYTCQRFWLYMATNTVVNILSAFFIFPWFDRIGVLELIISNFELFLVLLLMAIVIYGYQKWQESVLFANRE